MPNASGRGACRMTRARIPRAGLAGALSGDDGGLIREPAGVCRGFGSGDPFCPCSAAVGRIATGRPGKAGDQAAGGNP